MKPSEDVRDAGEPIEPRLKEQMQRAVMSKRCNAYDIKCMSQLAAQQGMGELADYLSTTTQPTGSIRWWTSPRTW